MRPLRITHVVRSDSFAGVERYVTDVATELSGRGHGVTVVGGDPELMQSALHSAEDYQPAATTREVAVALARLGRQDVVHAHMSAAEFAAVLTRPMHRAPVVATRHFASQRGGSRVSRAVTRTVARRLAREISISHFVADASGPGSVVRHNGVRDRPAGTDRDRTVLVMQRLEAEKDTATALRAFAACGLQSQGWRLQVAGRGTERKALTDLALDLGLALEWLGFVGQPDHLLARTGILLAPAPAEPFGLTVVEAMAAGTPVVASAGGAHVETVGPDGLLFPPYDVQACADLLRRAAEDPDGRTRCGKTLRARQQQLFALDRHIDALVAIYRSLR